MSVFATCPDRLTCGADKGEAGLANAGLNTAFTSGTILLYFKVLSAFKDLHAYLVDKGEAGLARAYLVAFPFAPKVIRITMCTRDLRFLVDIALLNPFAPISH